MKKCPLYNSKYNYLCGKDDECGGQIGCPHYQRNKENFDLYISRMIRKEFKNAYGRLVGIKIE